MTTRQKQQDTIPAFGTVAELATRVHAGFKGESVEVTKLALFFVVAQHISDSSDPEAALKAAQGRLGWFANLACGGEATDHGAPVH